MVFTSLLQKPGVFLGAFFDVPSILLVHAMIRYAFNDFGPKFTCVDPTGEQPLSGMIVSVDKACTSCDIAVLVY